MIISNENFLKYFGDVKAVSDKLFENPTVTDEYLLLCPDIPEEFHRNVIFTKSVLGEGPVVNLDEELDKTIEYFREDFIL